MAKIALSRRQVLRGAAGVAITLPFLESLAPRGARAQTAGPRHFVAIVNAPGFNHSNYDNSSLHAFWPDAEGALPSTLPANLAPLKTRGVLNDVQVIGGITYESKPASGGDHTIHSAGRVLVGKNLEDSDRDNKISSLDVGVHKVIRNQAALTTQRLTLGTAGKYTSGGSSGIAATDYDAQGFLTANGINQFGRLDGINASGSYADGVQIDAVINPRVVFNQLFCNGNSNCPGGGTIGGTDPTPAPPDPTLAPRKSVLHYVANRISALKQSRTLGTRDRHKLDEYLTGIEDIETRLTATSQPNVGGSAGVQIPLGDVYRSIPNTQNKLAKLHIDLIVKAFEANLMNVASLMLGSEDGTNLVPIDTNDARLWAVGGGNFHDHETSHNHLSDSVNINTAKMDAFAYLIEQLKGVSDQGGPLFNSTVIYMAAVFGDAHPHTIDDVPALIATGMPGLISGGTFKRYPNQPALRALASVAGMFGATLPQVTLRGLSPLALV